jgi:hypothetical protein
MLEALKVKLLVQRLGVRSESEAIRTVIDDFLFADDLGEMKKSKELRRGRGVFRVRAVDRRDHRTS